MSISETRVVSVGSAAAQIRPAQEAVTPASPSPERGVAQPAASPAASPETRTAWPSIPLSSPAATRPSSDSPVRVHVRDAVAPPSPAASPPVEASPAASPDQPVPHRPATRILIAPADADHTVSSPAKGDTPVPAATRAEPALHAPEPTPVRVAEPDLGAPAQAETGQADIHPSTTSAAGEPDITGAAAATDAAQQTEISDPFVSAPAEPAMQAAPAAAQTKTGQVTSLDTHASTPSDAGRPDDRGTAADAATADAQSTVPAAAGIGGDGIGGADITAEGAADEPFDEPGRAAAEALSVNVAEIDRHLEGLSIADALVHSEPPSTMSRRTDVDFSSLGEEERQIHGLNNAGKMKLDTLSTTRKGTVSTITVAPNSIQSELVNKAIEGMAARIKELSDTVAKISAQLEAQDKPPTLTQLATLYHVLSRCVEMEPTPATQHAIEAIYTGTITYINGLTRRSQTQFAQAGIPERRVVQDPVERHNQATVNEIPDKSGLSIFKGEITVVANADDVITDLNARLNIVTKTMPESLAALRAQEVAVHALLQQAAGRLGAEEYAQLQQLAEVSFGTIRSDAHISAVRTGGSEDPTAAQALAADGYLLGELAEAQHIARELGDEYLAQVRQGTPLEEWRRTGLSTLTPDGQGQPDAGEADLREVPGFIKWKITGDTTITGATEVGPAIGERFRTVSPEVIEFLGPEQVAVLEMLRLQLRDIRELIGFPAPFNDKSEAAKPTLLTQSSRQELGRVKHETRVSQTVKPDTALPTIRAIAEELAAVSTPALADTFYNVQIAQAIVASIIARLPERLREALATSEGIGTQPSPDDLSTTLTHAERERFRAENAKAQIASIVALKLGIQDGEQPFIEDPLTSFRDLLIAAEHIPSVAYLDELTKVVQSQLALWSTDGTIISLKQSAENEAFAEDAAFLQEFIRERHGPLVMFMQEYILSKSSGRTSDILAALTRSFGQDTADRLIAIVDRGLTDEGLNAAYPKGITDGTDVHELIKVDDLVRSRFFATARSIHILLHERLLDSADRPAMVLGQNLDKIRVFLGNAAAEIKGKDGQTYSRIHELEVVEGYIAELYGELIATDQAVGFKMGKADLTARNRAATERPIAARAKRLKAELAEAERKGLQPTPEVTALGREARLALAPSSKSVDPRMLDALREREDLSGLERWLLIRLATGDESIGDIATRLTAINLATTRILAGDEQVQTLRNNEATVGSYRALDAFARQVRIAVGANALTDSAVNDVLLATVDKLLEIPRNPLVVLLGGVGGENEQRRRAIADRLNAGLANVKAYLETGEIPVQQPAESPSSDRPLTANIRPDGQPDASTQLYPPPEGINLEDAALIGLGVRRDQQTQALVDMLSGDFVNAAQNQLVALLDGATTDTLPRSDIAILTAIAIGTFDPDAILNAVDNAIVRLLQTDGDPGAENLAIEQFSNTTAALSMAIVRLINMDEATREQVAGVLAANGHDIGQIMGELAELNEMLAPPLPPGLADTILADVLGGDADDGPDAGAAAIAQAETGTTETLEAATVIMPEIAERARALRGDISFVNDIMVYGGIGLEPTDAVRDERAATGTTLDIPRLVDNLSEVYIGEQPQRLFTDAQVGLVVALVAGGEAYFTRIEQTLARIQANEPDEALRYLENVGGAFGQAVQTLRETDLPTLALHVMNNLTVRDAHSAKDYENIFTSQQIDLDSVRRILSNYLDPRTRGTGRILAVIGNGPGESQSDEALTREPTTAAEAGARAQAEGKVPSNEVQTPGANLIFSDKSFEAALAAAADTEVTADGGQALLAELQALGEAETVPLTITDAAKLKALIDNPDTVTVPQVLNLALLGGNVDAVNKVLQQDRLDFNPLKQVLEDFIGRAWEPGEEFRRLPVEALIQADIRELAELMKAQHDRRETGRTRERGARVKPGFDTSRMLWILMLGQQPGWEVYQPKDSLLSGHFVVAVGPHKRYHGDTPETLIVMEAGVQEHATYATVARLLPASWDFVTRRVGKKEFRNRGWGFKLNHGQDDMAIHHDKFFGLVGRVRGIIDRHAGESVQTGGTSPLASPGLIVETPQQDSPRKAQHPAARKAESKPTRQPELPVAEERALIASLRPMQLPRPGEQLVDEFQEEQARRVGAYEQARFNELNPYLTLEEIARPDLVADEERRREHFPGAELTEGETDFLQLFIQIRAHTQDQQSLEGDSLRTAQGLGEPWMNFVQMHGQPGGVLERIDQVLELNEQYNQLLQHGQNLAININSARLDALLNTINHPLGMDSFGIPIDRLIKDLLDEAKNKMRAAGIDTTLFY